MKNHKSISLREMSNYVAGLTFIWLVFVVSFGWAYLRVSKSGKYGHSPFHAQHWHDTNWQNSQKTQPANVAKESDEKPTVSLAAANKSVASDANATPVGVRSQSNDARMAKATNPSQFADWQWLSQKLYHQIDKSWQNWPTFEKNLVYRVMVNSAGTIAEYQPLNQPAREYAAETPLPELEQTASAPPEPAAEFTVVFTPDGVLEVSP